MKYISNCINESLFIPHGLAYIKSGQKYSIWKIYNEDLLRSFLFCFNFVYGFYILTLPRQHQTCYHYPNRILMCVVLMQTQTRFSVFNFKNSIWDTKLSKISCTECEIWISTFRNWNDFISKKPTSLPIKIIASNVNERWDGCKFSPLY